MTFPFPAPLPSEDRSRYLPSRCSATPTARCCQKQQIQHGDKFLRWQDPGASIGNWTNNQRHGVPIHVVQALVTIRGACIDILCIPFFYSLLISLCSGDSLRSRPTSTVYSWRAPVPSSSVEPSGVYSPPRGGWSPSWYLFIVFASASDYDL